MEEGEIAPQEQFLLSSTIFCNLIFDFCVKTRTRFSLRDKRLFEITEVEITRVDCMSELLPLKVYPFTSKYRNKTTKISLTFVFLFPLNSAPYVVILI